MLDLDKLDNVVDGVDELDSMPDLPEDGTYDNPDKFKEPEVNNNTKEEEEEVVNEEEEFEELEEEELEEEIEEEDSDIEIVNSQSDENSTFEFDIGTTKLKVNSQDELKTITQNALKDKFKFDQYKEDISVIEGLKDQGVEQEDLYLLAAAKKGDQKALAKLIKKAGVDPYDLDVEDEDVDNYKPEEVKADMSYIEAKAILSDIKSNPEVDTKFNNLVMKEFDDVSRKTVFENTNNLQFVAELTKSGMLEQILPLYTKNKLLGSGTDDSFSLLVKSYDEYVKTLENQKEEKVKEVKSKSDQKAKKRKKAAAGTKQRKTAGKKDIMDMTDQEFEEHYKSLTGGYGFAV